MVIEVKNAWEIHPLRSPSIDKTLSSIPIYVMPYEKYGVNWQDYPIVKLLLPIDTLENTDQRKANISHELTHIIDRHDEKFSGGITPIEMEQKINNLRDEDYLSVKMAFHALWNAYIDGRLERRNIMVDSLIKRIEDKIGSYRMRHKMYENEEVEAVRKIWSTEPHTFHELVTLANEFPYFRPKPS